MHGDEQASFLRAYFWYIGKKNKIYYKKLKEERLKFFFKIK
jgi:hypothetical protein